MITGWPSWFLFRYSSFSLARCQQYRSDNGNAGRSSSIDL